MKTAPQLWVVGGGAAATSPNQRPKRNWAASFSSWHGWAGVALLAIAARCTWLWLAKPTDGGIELAVWAGAVVGFFACLGRCEQQREENAALARGVQIHHHYHHRR